MEKNIFLLKTKGLDRNRGALFADSLENGKLVKNFYDSNIEWKDCAYYHIYIISNEEIKIGDWCVNINSVYDHKEICRIDNQAELERYAQKVGNNCKKIILTTDPDLIKDGVQAIDDDFLDFFVENPTFEKIEVNDIKTIPSLQLGSPNGHLMYKIIIPKEEPKQKKLELKDGNQETYQFEEWDSLFELQSQCRKLGFSELEMHSALSNRFELKKK